MKYLTVFFLSAVSVLAEQEMYKIDRQFLPVEFDLQGQASAYQVLVEARRLEGTVIPASDFVTNGASSREMEAVSWGQDSAAAAWSNVLAGWEGGGINYDCAFDDPGWIKGVADAYGKNGAYLWVLQNIYNFRTSSDRYYWNGDHAYVIEKVLVGTVGDFDPGQNVTVRFPEMDESANPSSACTLLTSDRPTASRTVRYQFNADPYYRLDRLRVDQIDVMDTGWRFARDGLLEVVGVPYSENITAYASTPSGQMNPPGFPVWHLDGAERKTGYDVNYSVDAGVLESTVGLVFTMAQKTHELTAGLKKCRIVAYPSGHAGFEYDFGQYGKDVERALEKVPAFGKEVKSHIQLPNGVVSFENWWAERSDNTVMFCFEGEAGLDPLIGFEAEWPLVGVPLPQAIRAYVSTGVFLSAKGGLKLVGSAYRNAIAQGASGGLSGAVTIGIKLGAEVKDVLKIFGEASTEMSATGALVVENDTFSMKPKASIGGLTVKVVAELKDGKFVAERSWKILDSLTIPETEEVFVIMDWSS